MAKCNSDTNDANFKIESLHKSSFRVLAAAMLECADAASVGRNCAIWAIFGNLERIFMKEIITPLNSKGPAM